MKKDHSKTLNFLRFIFLVLVLDSQIVYANQELDQKIDQWLAGITTQIEFEKAIHELNLQKKLTKDDFEVITAVYEQKKATPAMNLKPYENLQIEFKEINPKPELNQTSPPVERQFMDNRWNLDNKTKNIGLGILGAVVIGLFMKDKKIIIYR